MGAIVYTNEVRFESFGDMLRNEVSDEIRKLVWERIEKWANCFLVYKDVPSFTQINNIVSCHFDDPFFPSSFWEVQMSKYESTWKVTFQLFCDYMKLTDDKFYVIKFASNSVGDIITSHQKFSEAVHTTLRAVDEISVSAPVGWYVAIWQKCKDGTCHRIGYNERWNDAFALGK